MRRHPLFKRLPHPQTLLQTRFLKPFAQYLEHHSLWQFNRRAVAVGAAIGLFFGILIPVGQIILSAFAAFFLRANLPVAAFATFITNPITTAGVYYGAYLVGGLFIGDRVVDVAVVETGIERTLAVAHEEVVNGWFSSTLAWIQDVGLQLLVGLSVLSVLASVVGYFAVTAAWHFWVRRRWQKRRLARLG